ncbi:MAG: glycosyltransferase [Thermoleophilaceae bacterium]
MSAARPDKKRLDLAVFIPTLEIGGAERVVVNLTRSFAEQGKSVDLVLARRGGALLDELDPRVRLRHLGASNRATVVPALARYLRHAAPRALLSHMDVANVAALLAHAASRAPTRIVVCSHLVVSEQVVHAQRRQDRWVARTLRWLYPRADAVVAVSDGVASDLADLARLPRSRITVIHNPVVTNELLARSHDSLEHPWFGADQPPVVVAAGRLVPQKDYPTLLHAFERARRDRPLRLMILGEGGERALLEGLIRKLDLAEDVSLSGLVENPYPYFAGASVLALSSAWEGFGNVLVEALACGTPVVSTDCPSGPGEILEGGRYGRLVPVGDHEALAAALLSTLDEPPKPDGLRRRAAQFTPDAAARRYLDLALDGHC